MLRRLSDRSILDWNKRSLAQEERPLDIVRRAVKATYSIVECTIPNSRHWIGDLVAVVGNTSVL
jgi:hypothetical protein